MKTDNYDKLARTFGIVLMGLLILIALLGCATPPKKETKTLDPIANAKTLGRTLGCVMAPNTCPKTPEQKQKEQDEITKDFNKVDQDLQKSK